MAYILALGCKEMKTRNGKLIYIQTSKVHTLPISGSSPTVRYINTITDFFPAIDIQYPTLLESSLNESIIHRMMVRIMFISKILSLHLIMKKGEQELPPKHDGFSQMFSFSSLFLWFLTRMLPVIPMATKMKQESNEDYFL